MTIEIYRKRYYTINNYVTDDIPEAIWHNVQNVEITEKHIFGCVNGEELRIDTDHRNYSYIII